MLVGACQFGTAWTGLKQKRIHSFRDPWVVLLVGWLLPLCFGLGGCLLLERRGRAYVQFTIINARAQARPIATPVACVVL